MKKTSSNILSAFIMLALVIFTLQLHAQSGQWKLAGNSLGGTEKLGSTNNTDVNLVTNGTTRMTLKAGTGNLGIGTSTPAAKLDVAGNVKIADGTQGSGKFLTSDANGLASWDNIDASNLLSTPVAPDFSCLGLAGTVGTAANPRHIFNLHTFAYNYAYVTNFSGNTMQVIDVGNPSSPKVLGSVNTGTNPADVFVTNGYEYVVNYGSNTLQIIGGYPTNPVVLGSISTGNNSGPAAVVVSGNYAYVANSQNDKLRVVDVSSAGFPSNVATITMGDNCQSMSLSGNYIYAGCIGNFQVIDISNPTSPVVVGSLVTPGENQTITVSGNHAYNVLHASNILQVIDISNPTNPVLLGSAATATNPYSVAVSGNYAYVGTGSNTMQIFNVSNPASPVVAGSIATASSCFSLAVSGNNAYVVNSGTNNLQVFNISCSPSAAIAVDPFTGATIAAPLAWNFSGNDIYNVNTANVGIGTSTPLVKLDVAGKAQVEGDFIVGGSDVNAQQLIVTNGSGYSEIQTIKQGIAFNNCILASPSTSKVGIGTFAPAYKLDVNGEGKISNTVLTSTGVGIGTTTSHAPLQFANTTVNRKIVLFETADNDHNFYGFGVNGAILRYQVDVTSSDHVFYAGSSVSSSTELMRIKGIGRVGIGVSSPGGQFELGLDQGRKPSTNTWTITSDERLKNIEGDYSKGLKEILLLHPISYHYKNVGEKTFNPQVLAMQNVGFSAQEVQKVFPEAVGKDDDGYLNFNIHSILVAEVNAFKELNAKVEDLKANSGADPAALTSFQNQLNAKDQLIADQQAQINALSIKLDEVLNKMSNFEISLSQCCSAYQFSDGDSRIGGDVPKLEQNVPNPVMQTSYIKFYIPSSVKSAILVITDVNGSVVKQFTGLQTGYGTVNIDYSTLASGTYQYCLMIDGKKFDSKQMILAK